MTLKKIIGKVHLWLGLTSGLVVFIVAITGCLYAFKDEIENATEPYRRVSPQATNFLLPSQLAAIARKKLPKRQLHAVKYNGKNKAAEAIFYHYEPTYYYTIYLNPYTGEIQKLKDMERGFFHFILDGHFYLWLPPTIGQPVVASSTLIFLIMLISGLILWFPINKAAIKQRFGYRWKKTTQWKRKNYDLHNVSGFYVSLLALVFAVTGLVWGFSWFAQGYYTALGGKKSLLYVDPVSAKNPANLAVVQAPLDKVWLTMQSEYPNAKSIEVHPPETDSSSIAANANFQAGTYWKTDYRYFNQYSLQEMPVEHIYGRLKNAGVADKLLRMNYDIHVGAIGGLAGKILAFCISLVIASLPITGFYIWYGRRWKKAKKEPRADRVLAKTLS
ncbi:PepSY-associated TM helix domain-containing protein [Haliscomenobacter hydrossis]|uniref:PepSY-associated TM helix domain protein n=1 Tax=Haliscomenobacter hydrossis (strain ATCC 27775 / DSM 1100 / LMG 10767 / O) TaxID=760192 RepID=F4L2U9_HALH1|nr:PepSY-associated TM helix domain-containing protein [Haliscomenobacter hydrossis]AEE49629.1 PepSY-associated TM helix domain protein [Haliscomenobacter hydrossis DSM 1100]